MIPEAYWHILGRWWWLIGALFLVCTAGAYIGSKSMVTYESQAVLEVAYVQGATGAVTFDEYQRRLEANRLAAELRGPWVSRALNEAFMEVEWPSTFDPLTTNIITVPPSRSESQVGPPIIIIRAQNSDPDSAELIAAVTAETYRDYIVSRHEEFITARRERAQLQVDDLRERLEAVLVGKRAAIDREATRIHDATEDLLETHRAVLATLPVVLDDFRRQVGSIAGVTGNVEGLDEALAELQAEIIALRQEWEAGVSAPLEVLRSAEAQPDFQLALVDEAPIRTRYEAALQALMTFDSSSGIGDPVRILETGTPAVLVPLLGLQTRYVLIGGAVVGLGLGWLLANLAEYLTAVRARRRAAQEHASDDEQDELPAAEEWSQSSNGVVHERVEVKA